MGFFWAAHRWEGGGRQKGRLPKICHASYNDKTWHGYTLPKEDPKNICRLINETHAIPLVQASVQANQFASVSDCAGSITNFTKF